MNVKDSEFHSFSRSVTIATPTDEAEDIYNHALKLYDTSFVSLSLRLVGVTLSHLSDKKDFHVQMSLFDIERHREQCATQLLIAELNRKYKKKVFISASELKKETENGD